MSPASVVREGAGLLGVAMLCLGAGAQVVGAQSPWTMSITPTVSPLPIGSCGAVWLDIKDSTGKDAPRNPQGTRVSIADFDMSVATGTAGEVAGEYNGPSVWSVCGCQSATVGSTATITADYPAKALAPRARVPGVSFRANVQVALAPSRGASNPRACVSQSNQVALVSIASPLGAGGATLAGAAPRGGTATGAAQGAPAQGAAGGGAAAAAGGGASGAAGGGAAGAGSGGAPGGGAPGAAGAAGGGKGGAAGAASGGAAQAGSAAPSMMTVVARAQWTIPDEGSSPVLTKGVCSVITGKFSDPNILASDVVVVTGATTGSGANLSYTPTVVAGAMTLKVCNDWTLQGSAQASGLLSLTGRKVNVLVLR